MSAPKEEEERESELSPQGTSAPSWMHASAVDEEAGRANAPYGDSQPDDGAIDAADPLSMPASVEPADGDAAATVPPPNPDLFEGDADIIELRRRLSMDPQYVPEPPLRWERKSEARSSSVVRSSLGVGAALLVACGVTGLMLSRGPVQISWNPGNAASTEWTTGGNAARPMAPALLVLRDRRAFINEPLSLGAVLLEGAGGEAIDVTGLIAGTRLSAGEPVASTGWRIPARDLAGVQIQPPSSFIGTMNAAIQLRSGSNALVDTQFARFEWVAKPAEGRSAVKRQFDRNLEQLPPVAGTLDPQRAARFVSRGQELIKLGDFAAARLVLRPAAEAGDPEAALMLGATFDPLMVTEFGALGLVPDPNAARAWYQRAMESGSAEASSRIERLARMPK